MSGPKRITVDELRKLIANKPKRMHVMGARRTELDGYSFASKLEASVYAILKAEMMMGLITTIQIQDHIYLSAARIVYIPDFKLTRPDGSFFWAEAKGFANQLWPTKKKLWRVYGPGDLRIYMGDYRRPFLKETIIPEPKKESK